MEHRCGMFNPLVGSGMRIGARLRLAAAQGGVVSPEQTVRWFLGVYVQKQESSRAGVQKDLDRAADSIFGKAGG